MATWMAMVPTKTNFRHESQCGNGKMRGRKEASLRKVGMPYRINRTKNYRSAGQEPAQILAMMPKRETIPRSQERDIYSSHEHRRVTVDH